MGRSYYDIHLGATNPIMFPTPADYSEFNITQNRIIIHPILIYDLGIVLINEIPSNVLSLSSVGLISLPTASDASVNLEGMTATISGYGLLNSNCKSKRN